MANRSVLSAMRLGLAWWAFAWLAACGPQEGGRLVGAREATTGEMAGLSGAASLRAHPRAQHIATVQAGADESYRFEIAAGSGAQVGQVGRQGLRAEMADGVLQLEPARTSGRDETLWRLVLRWQGAGRTGATDPTGAPVERPHVAHNRVRYQYPDGAAQYFVNGPLGIEQGFVLPERPAGDGELVLAIEVAGGLTPRLAPGGRAVRLETAAGRSALRYGELFAEDTDGQELAARLAVQRGRILLLIDDYEARYPVHVDPLVWTDVQKLVIADGAYGDRFGSSVAISGNYAIVGAPGAGDDGEGAAYVFARGSDDTWIRAHQLTASDGSQGNNFGSAVAILDDVALVGAPYGDSANRGAAYVFVRNADDEWLEVQRLAANPVPSDDCHFGASLALSANLLAVGTPGPGTGHTPTVFVFEPDADGTSWIPAGTLVASPNQPTSFFGNSVAISGDVVLVGAPRTNAASENAGAAFLFERDADGQWSEGQQLWANDGQTSDWFGHSVAISGDTLVLGAFGAEGQSGQDGGSVYLFERDVDSWLEVRKITASDGQVGDSFGSSVAVSAVLMVIGAQGGSPHQGAAYVFEPDPPASNTWSEAQKVLASDGDNVDQFGTALALGDGLFAVGAPLAANASGFDVGAVYLFELRNSDGDSCLTDRWCESGHCVDGVCCDSECGGRDALDCLACSVAAGATADGTCEQVPDGWACGDGTCSGGVCEQRDLGLPCSAAEQCASKHCVDHVCCEAPSCSPYRCQADTGQCGTLCRSVLDCVWGFRCTSEGLCEQKRTAGADDGCGCTVGRQHGGSEWALLALLGLAVPLRRTRRAAGGGVLRSTRPQQHGVV